MARRWIQRLLLLAALSVLGFGIDFALHKPAGEYCKSPSECRSRLCSGEGYCTQRCQGDDGCPAGFYCREIKVFTNKLDLEMAGYGVDVKGGTMERLCSQ